MFDQLKYARNRRAQTRRVGASLAAHGLLIGLLIHHGHVPAVRATLPGTTHGTRIELTYTPGSAPSHAVMAPPQTRPTDAVAPQVRLRKIPQPPPQPEVSALVPPPRPHLTPLRESSALSEAPASKVPDALAGNDSLGSGDIQIALTTYSPSPKPDLSQLPRGTQGDVVIDVTIDPTGKVADLQILHALGYGVEGPVLETVRTWTFRPATKDGIPIASVQELHFHFGPV